MKQTTSGFSSKSNFIWSCMIALTLLSAIAHAGGDGPGNGGDVVVRNGRAYLLDLVEAGIDTPKDSDEIRSRFLSRYREKLDPASRNFDPNLLLLEARAGEVFSGPEFTGEFRRILAASFSANLEEYGVILAALKLYNWKLIDLPLANIGDEESILNLSQLDVRQVAIRRDNSILINRGLFKIMDSVNQAALIKHEIYFGMVTPIKSPDGQLYQSSWNARERVATEFTADEIPYFSPTREHDGVPLFNLHRSRGLITSTAHYSMATPGSRTNIFSVLRSTKILLSNRAVDDSYFQTRFILDGHTAAEDLTLDGLQTSELERFCARVASQTTLSMHLISEGESFQLKEIRTRGGVTTKYLTSYGTKEDNTIHYNAKLLVKDADNCVERVKQVAGQLSKTTFQNGSSGRFSEYFKILDLVRDRKE